MPMPVIDVQRRRDPEATRASILDAAERLFVAKGFAATSMSEVAQAAEVTKSLIHHHFGSKEELWNEVKKRRVSEYAEIQRQLIAHDAVDEALLGKSIETYFRFLQQNPEFVRLTAWMRLEDPKLSAMSRPDLLALGVERLRQAQERGVLRSDLDPWHVLVCFLSLCMNWFMASRAYGRSEMADPDDQVADQAYLEDLLKVFLEGVLRR